MAKGTDWAKALLDCAERAESTPVFSEMWSLICDLGSSAWASTTTEDLIRAGGRSVVLNRIIDAVTDERRRNDPEASQVVGRGFYAMSPIDAIHCNRSRIWNECARTEWRIRRARDGGAQ